MRSGALLCLVLGGVVQAAVEGGEQLDIARTYPPSVVSTSCAALACWDNGIPRYTQYFSFWRKQWNRLDATWPSGEVAGRFEIEDNKCRKLQVYLRGAYASEQILPWEADSTLLPIGTSVRALTDSCAFVEVIAEKGASERLLALGSKAAGYTLDGWAFQMAPLWAWEGAGAVLGISQYKAQKSWGGRVLVRLDRDVDAEWSAENVQPQYFEPSLFWRGHWPLSEMVDYTLGVGVGARLSKERGRLWATQQWTDTAGTLHSSRQYSAKWTLGPSVPLEAMLATRGPWGAWLGGGISLTDDVLRSDAHSLLLHWLGLGVVWRPGYGN